VDWWPWCDEALAEARDRDKPVFLSVGYSTCHWCHVMERESFEDPALAEMLNEGFVPIKVDREERPDIDKLYMLATQLLTGQGGWPNSVFLTARGEPFFAGTYFPPEDRYGRPGFKTVLRQLQAAWNHNRSQIRRRAEEVAQALRDYEPLPAGSGSSPTLSDMQIRHALSRLDEEFDSANGGFGSAPKFPPHARLRLLLSQLDRGRDEHVATMTFQTLDSMCRGGIYDHVGGGFHRYATDAQWFLPHFEKMLYDNAQLAWIYADAHERRPEDRYRRTATQTCDWVLREMTHEEGGFLSALDADSEGQEGKFYLWSREEIERVLTEKQSKLFCAAFGVLREGNFRDPVDGRRPGTNVLYRAEPCTALSKCLEISRDKVARMLTECLEKLRAHRQGRVGPGRDEKILTAWNAMMISGLVRCGEVFDEPRYLDAARKAGQFLLKQMRGDDGRLLRTWRDGRARIEGYLEDYALLCEALVDLAEATGQEHWVDEACRLARTMVELFADRESGEFFFTAGRDESLLLRPRDWLDNATPSPAGSAVWILARLGTTRDCGDLADLADSALAHHAQWIHQAPTAVATLVRAAQLRIDADRAGRQVPPSVGPAQPVQVEAETDEIRLAKGSSAPARVKLRIREPWHIYGREEEASRYVPTSFRLSGDRDLSLGAVEYPTCRRWDLGPEVSVPIYSGLAVFEVGIVASPNASAGSHRAELTVRFQPCREGRCLEPSERKIPLKVDVMPAAQAGGR
jgi:hypothetical protein